MLHHFILSAHPVSSLCIFNNLCSAVVWEPLIYVQKRVQYPFALTASSPTLPRGKNKKQIAPTNWATSFRVITCAGKNFYNYNLCTALFHYICGRLMSTIRMGRNSFLRAVKVSKRNCIPKLGLMETWVV